MDLDLYFHLKEIKSEQDLLDMVYALCGVRSGDIHSFYAMLTSLEDVKVIFLHINEAPKFSFDFQELMKKADRHSQSKILLFEERYYD